MEAHNRAVLHLSGLATPLVLSVHSVVSWDFAMAIVPGWHATIFAPYFVAGAIFSGFAMVLTLMIPVRRIFGLEHIITDYHFENMSRFLLLTSLIVGYAYGVRVLHRVVQRRRGRADGVLVRAFGPYWLSTWIDDHLQRGHPAAPLVQEARARTCRRCSSISTLINIGMWFERYVIIIGGLSREYDPAVWGVYTPTWPELMIVAGSLRLLLPCSS